MFMNKTGKRILFIGNIRACYQWNRKLITFWFGVVDKSHWIVLFVVDCLGVIGVQNSDELSSWTSGVDVGCDGDGWAG